MGSADLRNKSCGRFSKALKQAFISHFVLIRPVPAGISRPIMNIEGESMCLKINRGVITPVQVDVARAETCGL